MTKSMLDFLTTLLINNTDSEGYESCNYFTNCDSEEAKVIFLRGVYASAYYLPPSAKNCKEYLQGLPSCVSFPFYDGDIIQLLENNDLVGKNLSDDEYHSFVDLYWDVLGRAFYNLIK